MRTTYLPDMSWKEAKEAFKETDLAFVPMGAIEAHGPHGLLGTDFFASHEVAKRSAAKSNTIAVPSIPYGYCESTMDFPGTISIDSVHYRFILEDIVRSLHKWGIRRVIWVTGHGPNAPLAKEVSVKLRRELGMNFANPLWYRLAIALLPEMKLGPDHGGFTETSVAMAIRPGNANLKEAIGGCTVTDLGGEFDSRGKYDVTFRGAGVEFPMFMSERWPLGYWDFSKPAVEASEAHGNKILDTVTDYLAAFAKEFQKLPLGSAAK
jgi:creatinine amidohydrolase